MFKQLVLLFNIVSYIIITALLPADVKIDTKLPTDATFVIDSTHIIDITISKGSIFGFAKFQQNIPDGFMAHPVETSEASFTFSDGKIKFIWMAIPEQNDVKISYALVPTQSAAVESFISGKFSYLQDNERKSYDIPDIPIKVISDKHVEEKIPAVASASREVIDLGGNQYEIKVTISKTGLEGFGKLEEYIPNGAEAEVVSNNKSVFSQVDDKVKFVWMAVPDGEVIDVVYSIRAKEDVSVMLNEMQGNFSFLDDNETKTVAVMRGDPIEMNAIADKNEASGNIEIVGTTADAAEEFDESDNEMETLELKNQKTPKAETFVQGLVSEEIALASKNEANEKDIAEAPGRKQGEASKRVDLLKPRKNNQVATGVSPKVNIPNPENGVTYRVQLLAGKRVVSEQFVRKVYAFNEKYDIENHDGWVKYTTRGFDVYKKARDKRVALVSAGHRFPGPFVTAYNSGERITVQEALMISNQKWYK